MITLFGLRAAALAAFLLAATVWSTSAAGQMSCGPRNGLADQLKQRFGETRQALGVSTDGQRIVELFMRPGGSWTIVVTDIHGRSCILFAGENWTQAPKTQGTLPQNPREPNTGISWGWVAPHLPYRLLARLWRSQGAPRADQVVTSPSSAASMLAETSAVA